MAEGPLEIEDLPGVGPSTADKLREAGYLSVESIATAAPAELSEVSEISEVTLRTRVCELKVLSNSVIL